MRSWLGKCLVVCAATLIWALSIVFSGPPKPVAGQVAEPTSISVSDARTAEGNPGENRRAPFVLDLTSSSSLPVTVRYTTAATGSAASDKDYRATQGMASFAPGDRRTTVDVSIIADDNLENDETFELILTEPVNASLADSTAQGLIENDDPLPQIRIGDSFPAEGNAVSHREATLLVSMSAPSGLETKVDYATFDQTAVEGVDYVGTGPRVLTIPPETWDATVRVTLKGDSLYESDETFQVRLSKPANSTLTDDEGIGTIKNDDPKPSLAINSVSVEEGHSGQKDAVFTVSAEGGTAEGPISVDFAAKNDPCGTRCSRGTSATDPTDYAAVKGRVNIAPQASSATIAVPVHGDTIQESLESFLVELSGPNENAQISRGAGKGEIINDDFSDTVGSVPNAPVWPGSQLWANEGAHLAATIRGYDMVTGDSLSQCVPSPNGNGRGLALDPIDGSFWYTYVGYPNPTGTGLIHSVSPAPECLPGRSIPFGDGPSGPAPEVIGTVPDPIGAIDFDPDDANLWVASYVKNHPFLYKVDRTTGRVIASCSYPNPMAGTPDPFLNSYGFNDSLTVAKIPGLPGSGKYLLTDGGEYEDHRLMAIDAASCQAGEPGTLVRTFELPIGMTGIDFEGETLFAADYRYIYNLGRIPFWKVHSKIPVPTNLIRVGPEDISLPSMETLGPRLTIEGNAMAEGNYGFSLLPVTVRVTPPSTEQITVDYVLGDQTATASNDYVQVNSADGAVRPQRLNIAAGETSKTIYVPIVGDTEVEEDEIFSVELLNPSKAAIGVGKATATIINDDGLAKAPDGTQNRGFPSPQDTGKNGPGSANTRVTSPGQQVSAQPSANSQPQVVNQMQASGEMQAQQGAQLQTSTAAQAQFSQQTAVQSQNAAITERQRERETEIQTVKLADPQGETYLATSVKSVRSYSAFRFAAVGVLTISLVIAAKPGRHKTRTTLPARNKACARRPARGIHASRSKRRR